MNLKINQTNYERNPHSRILHCLDEEKRFALLSLINIEGNAPYPLGTQMLVEEDGHIWGQITGGCAEAAMVDQALMLLKKGQDKVFRYGLNSPFVDIQLPCGSGIDVHFQIINVPNSANEFSSQMHNLTERKAVSEQLETQIGIFHRQYLPQHRLMIFGQGPILFSLCELAMLSGFDVIVITQDDRQEQALQARGIASQSLTQVQNAYLPYCDPYTALVSLFHEHDREHSIFLQSLHTPMFYLGALGSKATQAKRLAYLSAQSLDQKLLTRIHGPVGLDIQANTPQQIAVSIIAEVISKLPQPSVCRLQKR